MEEFKILTDEEHIRKRFSMYGGSRDVQEEELFIDGEFKTVKYSAGLIKIISEIIDNSVDEYIRTNGEYADKIDVIIEKDVITVKDNGRGIPAKLIETPFGEMYQMVAAFTQSKAGSNFNDEDRAGIGANGVGSCITQVCSTEFKAQSDDGNKCIELTKNNILKLQNVRELSTKKQGTIVTFKPDYNFFGLTGMDEVHISVIKERIKALSVAFPIRFTFNKKRVKETFNSFFGNVITFKNDKSCYGITKSNGTFKSFSIVNGLSVKGGSHIDYFYNLIADEFIVRLKRNNINITKSRLKQHLEIFCVINNFKNLKFDSQTKERITNSQAEIKQAIGEYDVKKIVQKLVQDKELIKEIKAYTKLQEDLKSNKDLKKLEKKKKVKSDVFIDSVGKTERIFAVEGLSAQGGLSKVLGRNGNAFYALKGVPMNVMEISHQKFMANKELSELYTIISNNPDADVIIANDADADGNHIAGLFSVFIYLYFPNIIKNGKFKLLKTPIVIARKGNKLKQWVYDFDDIKNIDKSLTISYVKGLGSWSKSDLQYIIERDGFESLLKPLVIDDESVLKNWFISEKSDWRKERISENESFNIMKI